MTDHTGFREIGIGIDGMVATVKMRRLDAEPAVRTIVLAVEGRSFCAGADFSSRMNTDTVQEATRSGDDRHLYLFKESQ